MLKKAIIVVVVVTLLVGAGYYAFGLQNSAVQAADVESEAISEPIEAGKTITAEGQVVPVKYAGLGFSIGGVIDTVRVAAGDRVEEGELIARVNAQRLEAAVAEAESALAVAQATLEKTLSGPLAADVAVARAAIEVAEAGVQSAEAAVASAEANLSRAQADPDVEQVAIAQRRVEQAKNALWAAQAQRDAVCGRVKRGGQQADCDACEAAVHQSEEAVQIARLELQQLCAGPDKDDVAAARAQLDQALGQRATADAQVRRAQADLVRAQGGSTPEDIAIARAQVTRAQVALENAQAGRGNTELRAPFAGTIVALQMQVGEYVGVGQQVGRLANLEEWRVETTDLSELNIVRVSEGDPVVLAFDAIPDFELNGSVTRIEALGEMTRGEIAYVVVVTPERFEPRLRWKMTAAVSIEPSS